MRRLILFLIRRKLGLKKLQQFRFANQRSTTDTYYFTSLGVYKIEGCKVRQSTVSLNWLLDSRCEIIKLDTKG